MAQGESTAHRFRCPSKKRVLEMHRKQQARANCIRRIHIEVHANAASIKMLIPPPAKPCFDTDPELTEFESEAAFAGGRTTASIVCTTPLLQGRSADFTIAAPNAALASPLLYITAPVASLVTVTFAPCTVAGDCVSLRSADMILPLRTWYFKMSARSDLAKRTQRTEYVYSETRVAAWSRPLVVQHGAEHSVRQQSNAPEQWPHHGLGTLVRAIVAPERLAQRSSPGP